ncbi:MAG: aspartate-semialdehyde dehydrogenase [Planctomycetes bacterium]|nr:aspartate-semialdehyde dehydrogenase [Planctomycetota bacterium]
MNKSNGSGLSIAVVGASGAVGREFLRVMEQRNTPVSRIRLFTSSRSAGGKLVFRGESVALENYTDDDLARGLFKGTDVVLLSAGATVSRRVVPAAVRDGALAIDNSSAYREDPAVPLIVPEVNGHRIADHRGIIANPNCTAAILLMALAPIHRKAGVKRAVVSTYQSVSGKGARAIDECLQQSRELLATEGLDRARVSPPSVFTKQIAFNVIPQIDDFESDGRTKEEIKVERESRRILESDSLRIDATCVRVPVLRCHSESVNIELERDLDPREAREIWRGAPGVVVMDEPANFTYPTPVDAEGRDEVLVGRCRRSRLFEKGLAFWCVGDQLRKGAALNAIQILEACLKAQVLSKIS